jgi:GDPmannose 4,6-dehydratase
MKRALITGVTGQDGAYLTAYLLKLGYHVHGLVRPASVPTTQRIAHFLSQPSFSLHYGDMTDTSLLVRLISEIQPDEVYNLAAQSHVGISFTMPEYTAQVDALGTLRLLEALRITKREHATKLYHASTSELFGKVQEIPQKETTPFYPRSPYGVAKLYAYWIIKNYRESYGIFACNGILFNHESPLRGHDFVTRKITRAVAAIVHGSTTPVRLGNLDAQRDWGHAKDYVRAMVLMLAHHTADDFIIATGKNYSVRYCVERAFAAVGMPIIWVGTGLDEKGINADTGALCVEIDAHYFRPSEVDLLCGDATKARNELGWEPTISFEAMIQEMVMFDCNDIGNNNSNAKRRSKGKSNEKVWDNLPQLYDIFC